MTETTRMVCKNCLWWESPRLSDVRLPGICPPTYGTCEKTSTGAPDSCASFDSIGTGPEFGCVEWEAKPVVRGKPEPRGIELIGTLRTD